MRLRRTGPLLLGLALLAPAARVPAAGPELGPTRPPLLLANARVLDPAGEKFLPGRDVLLAGGRIAGVGPAGSLEAPEGTTRIDLAGFYLIPGLIDLHTHFLLHAYDETPWDDQVLREPLELRTVRGVVAARTTLEAGYTTVRELGTEGAGFADVALRDAIAAGMIPGPRIFAATRALVATGSYGPMGFDPRWDGLPKGAQVADGPEGMRRAVREQIAAGADWIKVYADYRRRPNGIRTPTFTREEIAAAVDEAKSAGLEVAAHATTDEGMKRAVEAGVSTIEHGYGGSAKTFALLRERKVVLCPTLAAVEALARYGGWKPGDPEPQLLRESKEGFARARAAGVTIACGSDAGVFTHGENVHELELMVAYGMTTREVLRAATATAAAVLRRGDELGTIAPGYAADLVALSGDPLADISRLWEPAAVFRDGAVVHTRGLRRTE